MTDTAIAELAPEVGVRAACERRRRGAGRLLPAAPPEPAAAAAGADPAPGPPPAAGADRGRAARPFLDQLHSDRFVDVSPAEVWATLLDEGVYLGSISTFYRLLRQAGESRERRRQATHPATVKPELVATEPNRVWSWDITKLHGPAKWTYYYLYVIFDIYSRYVVGWMLATRESAALAEVLIRQTCAKQGIGPRPADHPRRPRLLDDLQAGRVPARRPRRHPVPQPPARLQRQPLQRGPVQDAEVPARLPRPVRLDRGRTRCLPHVLRLVQRRAPPLRAGPAHPGRRPLRHRRADPEKRAGVLDSAYAAHPERFVRKPPQPPKLPTASWINPPDDTEEAAQ